MTDQPQMPSVSSFLSKQISLFALIVIVFVAAYFASVVLSKQYDISFLLVFYAVCFVSMFLVMLILAISMGVDYSKKS